MKSGEQMQRRLYSFRFRTGRISIDHEACLKCGTYACVKADRLFGTSVLRIQDGSPVLAVSPEDAQRTCNECMACEIYCQFSGNRGLRMKLDTIGLEDHGQSLKGKEVE